MPPKTQKTASKGRRDAGSGPNPLRLKATGRPRSDENGFTGTSPLPQDQNASQGRSERF